MFKKRLLKTIDMIATGILIAWAGVVILWAVWAGAPMVNG